MKHTATAIAVAASLGLAAPAFAKKCNIVGGWTDTYGVTATFTSEFRGTATAPAAICPNTYKIRVTKLSTKVFDSTGTATGCPTVKAALKFAAGSCTSASGTISVGTTKLSDTWTKTSALRVSPAASSLLDGLRD